MKTATARLVATLVLGCLVPAVAAGQDATAPRTSWGAPDLGGVWDFRTITPLERSAALKDKAVLTAEDAAAFTRQTLESRNADRRDGGAGLQACEARRKPCPTVSTRLRAGQVAAMVMVSCGPVGYAGDVH